MGNGSFSRETLAPFSWDPHKLGFSSQLKNTPILELSQAV